MLHLIQSIEKLVFLITLILLLSDTVGFVSDLPTELIESFKATLDEVIYADLIVHVRDISHKDYNSQNVRCFRDSE